MMWKTNDPLRDFDRWDTERQEQLNKLPKCAECDKPIQQENAVCIKGDYYCDECLDEMREPIGGDD